MGCGDRVAERATGGSTRRAGFGGCEVGLGRNTCRNRRVSGSAVFVGWRAVVVSGEAIESRRAPGRVADAATGGWGYY